ncbi:MAG: DUF3566 domain-containing protein [Actinobacteria bacterium]|nr:DUF3566 domain-containing protein [Actinomycetota bacterium]
MVRRKMTVRRIDPWSVLKFGAIINACILVIALLGFGLVWFLIRQLGIIEQACQLATDVGFEECGINGGNLFRMLLLVGILGVIIATGLVVLFTFLYNLIADLIGGIELSVSVPGGMGTTVTSRSAPESPPGWQQGGQQPSLWQQGAAGHSSTTGDSQPSPAAAGTSAGGGGNPSSDSASMRTRAPTTGAPSGSRDQQPTGALGDTTPGAWPWERVSRGGGSGGGTSDDTSDDTAAPTSGASDSDDTGDSRRSDESIFGGRGDGS